MRIALALLLLVTPACAGRQPAPGTPSAAVVGIWRVTQVNGRDLPAASPQEANVTVERASLMLQANRNYTLSITARTGQAPASERSQSGTWSAGESTLTLSPDGARPTRFDYRFSAGTLTLREGSTVYTLVRS
ncbi:MAG TPA: lipocalin family protein [Longimicrobium sp.]